MPHVQFEDIYSFLTSGKYPADAYDKGKKVNFRRQSKPFYIDECKLFHITKGKKVSSRFVSLHENKEYYYGCSFCSSKYSLDICILSTDNYKKISHVI